MGGAPQVDHLSRDRSHSMPNVRTLSEQQVGRELRRLSDDFYNFHCNRRRVSDLTKFKLFFDYDEIFYVKVVITAVVFEGFFLGGWGGEYCCCCFLGYNYSLVR